jgi:hypothetical protein
MSRQAKPLRHVEAHLAKSNDSKFHQLFPFLMQR